MEKIMGNDLNIMTMRSICHIPAEIIIYPNQAYQTHLHYQRNICIPRICSQTYIHLRKMHTEYIL